MLKARLLEPASQLGIIIKQIMMAIGHVVVKAIERLTNKRKHDVLMAMIRSRRSTKPTRKCESRETMTGKPL